MDIIGLLGGISTPVLIVIAVLFLVAVGGWIWERYKGKKLQGFIGKIVHRSDEAAMELYRATDEESKGGKRVVPSEWVDAGKMLFEKKSQSRSKR